MEFILFDIKFRISFWFLMFISVASILSSDFHYVIISLIIHEASHTLFLLLFKGRINEVSLSLKDINIKSNVLSLPQCKSIVVLLAGSAVNILAGLIFLNINRDFSYTNFVIGIFQLLPISSSDFDNIIALFLKGRFYKVKLTLYFIFALFIFLIGIMIFLESRFNYSLLITGIYLIIKTIL